MLMKAQSVFLYSLCLLLILGFLMVPLSFSDEPVTEKTITKITRWASRDEICYSDLTCNLLLYSGQMNYWNNAYVPIDTTITENPSSEPLYDYGVETGIYKAFFKENPSTAQSVKFYYNQSYLNGNNPHKTGYVTYQPMSLNYRNDLSQLQQISMIQSVIGNSSDNVFTYPDAFGTGINISYEYWNEQLKEKLTIVNLSVLPELEQYVIDGGNPVVDLDMLISWKDDIDIYIDGAVWNKKNTQQTSNRVDFKLGDEVLFYLPKPIAYDSNDSQIDLEYIFKKSGGSLYTTVRTPYSWLNDSSRVYPVNIDPTIVILQDADTENMDDTYVSQSANTTNYGNQNSIAIRKSPPIATYIKFNMIQIPININISNANLGLVSYFAHDTGTIVYLYRVYANYSWNETSITYVNQPCGIDFDNSSACDLNYANSSLTSAGLFKTINVTSLVSDSYNDNENNVTIAINHTIGGNDNYYYFRSKEYTTASVRPYLNITYALNVPEFNTNITIPSVPLYMNNVTLQTNVTSDDDTIIWVNFTLIAPNGTWVINNTNGTNINTDLWNSTMWEIDKEGQWNISVLASESDADTTEQNWTFTIVNSVPTFDQNLAAQNVHHHLNLTYDVNCSDSDGNSINYTVNDSMVSINESGVITDNPAITDEGTYNISVTCNDTLNTTTQTFLYTVINNPPVPVNVTISPSPAGSASDLNCTYAFTDNESDAETNQFFKWFLEGVETGNTSQILGSGNTTGGDSWTCSVMVEGGNKNSSYVNSSTLVIGDSTPPLLTGMYISSYTGYTDTAETIYASCSDVGSNIEFVRVEYINPNGENVGNKTMTLASGTQYSYSYTFNIPGTYINFTFHCKDQSGNYNHSTTGFTFVSESADAPGGGGGSSGQSTQTNITKFKLIPDSLNLVVSLGIPRAFDFYVENQGDHDAYFFPECSGEACPWLNFPTKQILVPKDKTSKVVFDITAPSNTTLGNYTFELTGNDAVNELKYKLETTETLGYLFSIMTSQINIPGVGLVDKWMLLLAFLVLTAVLYWYMDKKKGKFWISTAVYLVIVGIVTFIL